MEASTKLWAGFRMCRVVVFAIATIMSMALSVVYAIVLLREWKFYNDAQHAIVIIILVIYGFSAILLYLMIIVRFRLWLDGARVALLVLFQGGATVTFAIFKSSLPCNNLGTVQTCKTVSTVAIFAGWSLTGLLVLYAFCLAIMFHAPKPPLPANPEESLCDKRRKPDHISSPSVVSSASSRTWIADTSSDAWSDRKHRSFFSGSGLEHSQASWHGSGATTPRSRTDSLRSQSTTSSTEQYGVYRPATPQSIRSPAASSISGSVDPDTTGSTYNTGRFTPQPLGYYSQPATPPFPPKVRLPNPFMEPPSRSGTPASVASIHSDGFLYTAPYGHTRNLTGHPIPRSLLAGDRTGLPPASEDQSGVFASGYLGSTSPNPEIALHRLNNNSTPFTWRPGVSTGDIHGSLKSPVMTVLSHSASIHIPPNRSASLLSVPRSPSPRNLSPRIGLPTSPRALVLPTRPRLCPVDLRGPQRFQEVRRLGSSPDLRTDPRTGDLQTAPNTRPMARLEQPASGRGSPALSLGFLTRSPEQMTQQVRFTPT